MHPRLQHHHKTYSILSLPKSIYRSYTTTFKYYSTTQLHQFITQIK